jgi:hypothetical protein
MTFQKRQKYRESVKRLLLAKDYVGTEGGMNM